MNSFYFLLIMAAILATVTGWLAGFVRIILFLLKFAVASIVAYLLQSILATVISNNFNDAIAEWAQVISFVILFLVCIFFIQLLFLFFLPKRLLIHTNVLNKLLGAMSSAVIAVVFVFLVSFYSVFISVPADLSITMKENGIWESVNKPVKFIDNKVIPVFSRQPVKVMASKTPDSAVEKGITLEYSTANFSIRTALESEMLELINIERSKYGLRILTADTSLTFAARLHSADMFTKGYFSHDTPDGISPFQRLHKLNISYLYAGENLAMAPTVVKAHDGLMKSPGHRANILNPSYGRVGIGILDGGTHGLMITQEFKD